MQQKKFMGIRAFKQVLITIHDRWKRLSGRSRPQTVKGVSVVMYDDGGPEPSILHPEAHAKWVETRSKELKERLEQEIYYEPEEEGEVFSDKELRNAVTKCYKVSIPKRFLRWLLRKLA